MILRNPAAWRDSFLRTILSAVLLCIMTTVPKTQGIIGTIVESFSRTPVADVHVDILLDGVVIDQADTDSNGRYEVVSTKAGRIAIHLSAAGYVNLSLEDIMLDGYTTYRFEHLIEKESFDLPGVTVVSSHPKPLPFIRTITPDDMVLVAGNFEDPVRVAHSQPGIVLLNDQANQISARGKSPVFNTWMLEGLDIVNPNHTSNAGTFSDLPTQYGGGVNMFSAQSLGSTDVYIGINPMVVNNLSGAAVDMHLHESPKPEWRAKAGLIGLEFGGATSLGASGLLDFNFRYSFTGLLTSLGADFGGEKIGFYDGVVSYRHEGASHKLKVFAWGGHSFNTFEHKNDPADIESYKDFFDIDYENDILGTGATYKAVISSKLNLNVGAAYSTNQSSYSHLGQYESHLDSTAYDGRIFLLSSFVELNIIHSARFHSAAGLNYRQRSYANESYPFLPFMEESLLRPYINTNIRLSSSWHADVGVDVSRSFTFDTWDPGYRAELKWNYDDAGVLFAGIRYGIGEALFRNSSNSISNHITNQVYEMGWNASPGRQNFTVDLYYQKMGRLVEIDLNEGFIHMADYPFVYSNSPIAGARHEAMANYYGVEGQWEMNSKGWRWNLNQSVFRSERDHTDGNFSSGRYNGQYATHVSIAKEIVNEKEGKARIWNFSLRGLLHGGLWEEKIDITNSALLYTTVSSEAGTFDQHLQAYKRIDLSIVRTIAFANVRWRYSLDIQNVLGLSNIAYHYYDPYLGQIKSQAQLSFIPVFSVQASW